MRILNPGALSSHGNRRGRRDLVQILEAGLRAADPYCNTLQLLRAERGSLVVGQRLFEPSGTPHSGDEEFDLHDTGRIFVFGAGKGSSRPSQGSWVVIVALAAERVEVFLGIEGGHTACAR